MFPVCHSCVLQIRQYNVSIGLSICSILLVERSLFVNRFFCCCYPKAMSVPFVDVRFWDQQAVKMAREKYFAFFGKRSGNRLLLKTPLAIPPGPLKSSFRRSAVPGRSVPASGRRDDFMGGGFSRVRHSSGKISCISASVFFFSLLYKK